jgi:hypothetical protein
MKLNFGHKIAIGYSLFVVLIIGLVVSAFQFDFDLDEENYYAKEIVFEDEIQAVKSFNALGGKLKLQQGQTVKIQLPDSLISFPDVEYTLLFKRPSDKRLDWQTVEKANNGWIDISWDQLVTGVYLLELDFKIDETSFHFESDYFLNPVR